MEVLLKEFRTIENGDLQLKLIVKSQATSEDNDNLGRFFKDTEWPNHIAYDRPDNAKFRFLFYINRENLEFLERNLKFISDNIKTVEEAAKKRETDFIYEQTKATLKKVFEN